MSNPRLVFSLHRVDAHDATFLSDSSIVPPVPGANGYVPNMSAQLGMAVAVVNTGQTYPQCGLGQAGDRLLGKLMVVEVDGTCAVQHEGFMYLPFNTSNPPQVGKSVVVDGTGKVKVSPVVTAVNQIQTATQSGTWTSGTFTATYEGQTTAPISYLATGANVATALSLLSNVQAGGYTGSGSAGGPFVITAAAALAGQLLPAITYDTTLIVGGGTIANVVGTPGAESSIAHNGSQCMGYALDPEPLVGSAATLAIVKL